MQITVFGQLRVRTAGRELTAGQLGGVKPRQILQILAVADGDPVSKERLADLLWDGEPPRSWVGTLESYVCVLRRSLREAGGEVGVLTVRQGYVLDGTTCRVDLTSFRSLVRRATATIDDPGLSLRLLEEALDLVSGPLLVDEGYAAWALAERERLLPELVTATNLAAAHALVLGRPYQAVRHAESAIAHDRLGEQGWRSHMQALRASGRRSEALRDYFELRDLLLDQLGVEPSQDTTDLYLDLLRTQPPGCGPTGREEVGMLLGLLQQAVMALPHREAPRGEAGWVQLARQVSAASAEWAPTIIADHELLESA